MLVQRNTSYDTEYILEFSFRQRANEILGDDFTEGEWEPLLTTVKLEKMQFFSFIIYVSWKAFKRQQAPNSSKFVLRLYGEQ